MSRPHPDTDTDIDATRALRAALAQQLADSGALRSKQWRRAVEAVPRHRFVPFFYRQDPTGWQQITTRDPGYLGDVYGDTSLTTQLTGATPTSSSSQPSLMLQMLEALDLKDGQRVLEIATGTGYNAALLCERLGSRHVYSVEVDRDLARLARERLHGCGYTPTVIAADGRQGLVAAAPFDALIATCGFTTLPYPWIKQVRPGGTIVSPLGWGNIRLTVHADGTATGGFLPSGSFFMPVREEGGTGAIPYPGEPSAPTTRDTALDPATLTDDGFRFLLTLTLPAFADSTDLDDAGTAIGHRLWSHDGSWTRATAGRVEQAGPRRLWDAVEAAYAWYAQHDRPVRERYGLTVTSTVQTYWLDHPQQPLPPAGPPSAQATTGPRAR